MAKTKFIFDKTSGTMKPEAQMIKENNQRPAEKAAVDMAKPPKFEQEAGIQVFQKQPNADMNESIIQFRENTDYSIFTVNDERTGRPMMYIGGYALDIKFNMAELRSTKSIEQLLTGLSSLFRKLILEQALDRGDGK